MPSADILAKIDKAKDIDADTKAKWKTYFERRLDEVPFTEREEGGAYLYYQLDNVWASQCFSCDEFSLWVGDELVYPEHDYEIEPNAEMPQNVKNDFLEAGRIVQLSPRGAAALLRLCIQKLVIFLGETGDNLNSDIAHLVETKKITTEIQQALDVVRVVGNHAVHPGTIDFDDNIATASQLFGLVNVIVEWTIAAPKHIAQIYEDVVPEQTRAAITKRDAPKSIEPPKDT